ncbi:hypothetical protein A0H76_2456 [Hepatospora eriocheir]|uniref:GP-PDE domain-containing protein n=1 Tax=Hepatospora eriocheir TaxID=1081669 RepID=A0A1X0QFA3_9MICR|nr:hypothetical protein A0H76_2456 [Hepatospora eriocheir]
MIMQVRKVKEIYQVTVKSVIENGEDLVCGPFEVGKFSDVDLHKLEDFTFTPITPFISYRIVGSDDYHRENNIKLPKENSYEAGLLAKSLNIEASEIDLQLTKDNYVVIYHDDYVKYNGSKKYIYQNTFADLVKFDSSIYEFSEILKVDLYLNLELKCSCYPVNRRIDLFWAVIDILTKFKRFDRFFFSSFDWFTCFFIKSLTNCFKSKKFLVLGLICCNFDNIKSMTFEYYSYLDGIVYYYRYVDDNYKKLFSNLIAENKDIGCYDVITKEEFKKAKKVCNFVISDNLNLNKE